MKSKIILIFSFLFICASCKTPCTDPSSISYQMEQKAISYYQCQNGAALISDWNVAFNSIGLCATTAAAASGSVTTGDTGPVADLICPVAIPMIVGAGASFVIKSSYQCNSKIVGSFASSALTSLCELIPFSSKDGKPHYRWRGEKA